MFRRRGPDAETAAASRELSRQGVIAMEAGHWEQAESLLRRSLNASPDDAVTHRYLAETLWRRGAKNDALSQMDEAIRLDPIDANHLVRAGEMSLSLGKRDIALAHAERAIHLEPKLSTAWALRGRTFWQMSQPDRAMADLQSSLAFEPASTDVMLDVATIYRQRGQQARCLTTLHRLIDTYPSGEEPQSVLLLEGLTLIDLERPQQAVAVLTVASQKGAPNVPTLYALAQAQSAAGRHAEATVTAQSVLALDASHQPSRELLALLAARTTPAQPERR